MVSYSFKKKIKRQQKDMDKQLLSKPDIMSSSDVMYPYVTEKILTQITKTSATRILSMN